MFVVRLLVALIPRRNIARRCFLLCFWAVTKRKTCRFDNRDNEEGALSEKVSCQRSCALVSRGCVTRAGVI